MELHGGGVARKFVLQVAENSPVVHRQHRVSPHPPFEFAHSELQFGAMPQGASDVRGSEADQVVLQPQIAFVPVVGRAAQKTGGLSALERIAPRAQARSSLKGCDNVNTRAGPLVFPHEALSSSLRY